MSFGPSFASQGDLLDMGSAQASLEFYSRLTVPVLHLICFVQNHFSRWSLINADTAFHHGELVREAIEQKLIGSKLALGISSVPVTCRNMQSGEDSGLQFMAGFLGVKQDPNDLSLRPLVGWGISESSKIDALVKTLIRDHACKPPAPIETRQLVDKLGGHLPGEMWRFYTQIDGAYLKFREPNKWGETECKLFGAGELKRIWDTESINRELEYLSERYEISPGMYGERREFATRYGELIVIGQATRSRKYVFGRIGLDEPGIYRWTGERTPEAFVHVASSFTAWVSGVG